VYHMEDVLTVYHTMFAVFLERDGDMAQSEVQEKQPS
jgi:hypothetical protein